MNEITPRGEEPAPRMGYVPRRRVSWGAIWAGMFVTVILAIMFTLLGVACGIASLNPLSRAAAAHGGLSLGAAIWLMLSWLVALWIGARVGGWMSGGPRHTDGTMHGVVIWSFSAAVVLLLLTGAAGTLLSSATSGGVVVVTPGNGSSLAGGANPPSANAPAPTGRGGEQPYQYSPGGSGGGDGNSARAQPFWGTALFSFIALLLGLGVAAWSGGTGADAAEHSLSATTA